MRLAILLFCLLPFMGNAQIQFTEIGQAAGVNFQPFIPYYLGGGTAFFDYNNDGNLDLFVTGGWRKDKLYRNNGDGTFTDVSAASGIANPNIFYVSLGVVTGDIDNDGDRDILVNTERGFANQLFRNNGNGTFTNITSIAGLSADLYSTYSSSFGDYDKDGDLDISIGHYVETAQGLYDSLGNHIGFLHQCPANYLYLNNGNNTFTNIANTVGLNDTACTLSSMFTDYDNDGDMDIANANDFGQWIISNQIFRNNLPNNNYTEMTDTLFLNTRMYGMGVAVGDYDQDMDLDYYMTNIGRNSLYRNMGAAGFIDTADAAGVHNTYTPGDTLWTTSWSCGFLDVDNDSYLDLFVANGYVLSTTFIINDEQDPNAFFHNNGDGTFTNLAAQLGLDEPEICHGFTYGDLDNDGDLDMFVSILVYDTMIANQSNSFLYRNDSDTTNKWLQVELEGVQTNRDAFGCHIEIYVGGRAWLHEISGGGTHSSQYSSIAHFGLASDTIVDSLIIHWLNSPPERYFNLAANQRLHLIEGMAPPPQPVGVRQLYQEPTFILFPNPASTFCNLQYNINAASAKQDVLLNVYNNLGQRINYVNFGQNTSGQYRHSYDLQGLSPGIYHFVLTIDGQSYTKQLVVK
jgi:hypothetical protein